MTPPRPTIRTSRMARSLLAFASLLVAAHSLAAEWRVAPIQVGDSFAQESRYVYVSKGEQWLDAVFNADFQTTGSAALTVSLDGRPLQSQFLTRSGTIQFKLPLLRSGFHRLDFSFKQQGVLSALRRDPHDNCEDSIDSVTTVGAGKIRYGRIKPEGYQIRNLPDALFNPQVLDAPAFVGRIRFDARNSHELTAIARLASAWPAVAGVRWLDSTLPESQSADFTIEVRPAPQLTRGSFISLSEGGNDKSGPRPYLLIMYKDAQALESVTHALLNGKYLAQIRSDKVAIPDTIEAPAWGSVKQLNTLADLGIEDFRLDSSSRSVPLAFPGAWQPTDLLQGQIALRAQSGLMQGSKLTVWLDDALAGSMRLDELTADTNARETHYLGRAVTDNTNFDLRLESILIANGDCLPRSRGALWVDTHKSLINLPHRLKSGVAGISPALVPHPDISIDGSPGSTGIAIALLQMSSKMLLGSQPVPANVRIQSDEQKAIVGIRTDSKIYQQRIAAHEDKVFGPYAAGGVLLISIDDHFEIIAQNVTSTINFMYRWPRVQAQLPDGANEVLITQDGEVIVLDRYIPGTKETPSVHESTVSLLIALVLLVMLAAIIWWFWRSKKNAGAQ